jgi:uncharacterized membrane protein
MKRKFQNPCAEFNSGLLETSPILFPLKTIENFNCFQCAILAYINAITKNFAQTKINLFKFHNMIYWIEILFFLIAYFFLYNIDW